jgi:hypothetical protein
VIIEVTSWPTIRARCNANSESLPPLDEIAAVNGSLPV